MITDAPVENFRGFSLGADASPSIRDRDVAYGFIGSACWQSAPFIRADVVLGRDRHSDWTLEGGLVLEAGQLERIAR
jgi:hypothetical protein